MFRNMRDSIINLVTSRLFVLIILFIGLSAVLIHKIFVLQIVESEAYLDDFQLKIEKKISLDSTRGNIHDRNGELLAYNELAYSVTIEDVYESSKTKNQELNNTVRTLIKMIEKNGDKIVNDFNIILNNNQEFEYVVEGTALLRFIADIHGKKDPGTLLYEQKTATADEMIAYLAGPKKFAIGEYDNPKEKKDFVVGKGYTKEELLKVITIRYALSLKTYQRYLTTTVASDVSDETVAVIMENSDVLEGVEIAETTIRRYVDSVYFSHILGYTGKISEEEYETLSKVDEHYTRNDIIGKAGIEQEMELELQGVNGEKLVNINNLGKITDVLDITQPVAGNDLYLTIDKNLQKDVYNMLEQYIAGILVSKIEPIKEFIPNENGSATDIKIPIDDVYFALINNGIIDIDHFSKTDAKEVEKQVHSNYKVKCSETLTILEDELTELATPYENLEKEYQVYESYIVSRLAETGIIISSSIDKEDEVYLAWKEEKISLKAYLEQVIANRWIDITKLDIDSRYLDSAEIYISLVEHIKTDLENNLEFSKLLYKYMIREDLLSGKEVCQILYEQKLINDTNDEREKLNTDVITPYNFMKDKITNLDITPAQLALDPCSGSCVITDVENGDVLALVTYPSYDNNRLANSIDAEYYARLNTDLAKPLWDYATQQKSAPGSTFKMVSAVAALEEGIMSLGESISCLGVWDTLAEPHPKCWINPGRHGSLEIEGAIQNSCNYYFYESGYRLGRFGNNYNNEQSLKKLSKYADMFGLSEKSGVEVVEEEPQVSDTDGIRSAIGQGTHNYTTAGLARYVTTVANRGTCYDLTLLDKVTDSNGNVIQEYQAEVRNQVNISNSTWNAVQNGMKKAAEGKDYFKELDTTVAGKTGTAQQTKTRPNHALFVSYAPFENPEIAIAVRITHGYAADYAGRLTSDIIKYYFDEEEKEKLLTGTANDVQGPVSREN